jgi:3',5'-cyclic AMP phosphodiesterase CpdA
MQRRNFLILGGAAAAVGLGKAALSSINTVPSPKLNDSSGAIAPANRNPLLLRFVATADSGSSNENQAAVATAMTRYYQQNPYKLVVLAGDNIYDNGEIGKVNSAFERPYQALLKNGVIFRACLGNHDIRSVNGDPQVQYPGFNMPGRYYTFRDKAVQFFVLDTNVNADWSVQQPWLEKELSRSNAAWKIVYGHHPIYSSGVYGNTQAFIETLSPLFKKYGVQLYINGHEHSYERTRPIDGTTYLITGNGGAYLRPVERSPWTEYSVSRYGFTAFEVFRDRINIQAIATDHQVFDQGIVPLKSA